MGAAQKPTKAKLCQGVVYLGFPVALMVWWGVRASEAQTGIFGSFNLFMGLVAIVTYFTTLAAVVLWHVQKVVLANFVEGMRANPLVPFTQSLPKSSGPFHLLDLPVLLGLSIA